MRKSFKFRIYFNKSQAKSFDSILDSCLNLYNNALEERINSYKNNKISISYETQCKNIKNLNTKKYEGAHSQIYTSTLKIVDRAYQNFFRRVKEKTNKVGFPRFKSKLKSITFPQCNLQRGGVKLLENNKLNITGIPGKVKIVMHRQIQGICKTAQIIKSSTNKYYISLSCDKIPNKTLPKTNKSCGIDLGIKSFATLDDGTLFNHPKPYKTSKEKLAYLNKKLHSAQKESKNREKIRLAKAKLYEKNSNIVKDFQHKLSYKLIKEYDTIYIEKLNIKGMLERDSSSKSLNFSIIECSWHEFANKLIYKAGSADKLVVQVNPINTSKMCSNCKNIKENLSLKDRKYICDLCKTQIDRDLNAAINIKLLGVSNYVK